MAMNYYQQLRHPLWQRKRLEVFQRDGFMCQSCLCEDKPLHAHHKRYVKGRKAWEYPLEELVTLCDDCHTKEHEGIIEFQGVVAVSGMTQGELTALVRGFSVAKPLDQDDIEFMRTLNHQEAAGYLAYVLSGLLDGKQLEQVYAYAMALFRHSAFGDPIEG